MVGRVIKLIVIHCSATANGVRLARGGRTAAQVIDTWHGQPVRNKSGHVIRQHMFERSQRWREIVRPHLHHIGYHYVIDTDGTIEAGRDEQEIGAHVSGHNEHSLGICQGGTDKFTLASWRALRATVEGLLNRYRSIELVKGHRELSPDKDGDGVIERHEWIKTCPGFDASTWWLLKNMEPMEGHILQP